MLPPGPRSPRLWQTGLFGREPLEFLTACRDAYGDVFTLRLAHEPPWVVLASAGAAAEALRLPPEVARAGEANAYLEPLLGRESVIVADGEDHLAKRRAAAALLTGRSTAAAKDRDPSTIAAAAAATHLGRWRDGSTVRVLPAMQALTLEVILAALFGDAERVAPLGRALTKLLRFATRQSSMLGIALLGYGAAARNPVLLARRRAVLRRIPGGDEQLLTLLVAGHDTTASALAWAVDLLSRHRPSLERLREDPGFADAVVRETLRLWPTVPLVSRRLAAPARVAGRDLPAGVAVVPCMLLIHRDRAHFREPNRFLPARWVDGDGPWLPFGGGTRRCLGASFAATTMTAVLQELARTVDVKPAYGAPTVVGRRGHTLVPQPAEVRVVRRSDRPAARPRAARAG
ncbi:MAG TPA: cytochrome P450 [Solirubrobacteraceae bacterium]